MARIWPKPPTNLNRRCYLNRNLEVAWSRGQKQKNPSRVVEAEAGRPIIYNFHFH
jgi:hypothetical protein